MTWDEDKSGVMQRLERLEGDAETHAEKLDEFRESHHEDMLVIRVELARLTVKGGLIGTLAGTVAAFIAAYITKLG